MNILIVLAGGVGKRAGASVPKQFLSVNKIPVIVYTLRKFQQTKEIDAICVVSHEDWIDQVKEYKKLYSLSKIQWIVKGGETGLESVLCGINALCNMKEDDLVLIHDAVRPFITQKAIEDNIRIASIHGVAVTSVPCVETLVKVDQEGKSISQVARDGLMRVMTPQTFKLGVLRDLFDGEDVHNSIYPSTFALYMSKGFPVYCSYGSERNIKITYPEDIEYLEHLFEA